MRTKLVPVHVTSVKVSGSRVESFESVTFQVHARVQGGKWEPVCKRGKPLTFSTSYEAEQERDRIRKLKP